MIVEELSRDVIITFAEIIGDDNNNSFLANFLSLNYEKFDVENWS